MPEGPEIRRAADRIAAVLEDEIVEDAWFAFERLTPWETELSGRRVERVEPRGKALLVRFEGGLNVYSHNQLYGRWMVAQRGKQPSTRRQLRVALHTAERSALLYSASEIAVLRDADLGSHPYLARLGPDVLDRRVTPSAVRRRMGQKRFRGRALAGLLLDQGFLGGVGNYLRSEILFVAGVDPSRRPRELDDAEARALARAALEISRRAYATRGITNDPEIVARLKGDGLSRRAYRHFVFGRVGRPCHLCGARIERSDAAGRRIYTCGGCQS